jgi:tetratricopeptide (TPR) repeat protein
VEDRANPADEPSADASPELSAAELHFLRQIARGSEHIEGDDEDPARWLPERFEGLRWLGAGGFGEVYEAFDRARGARVALKVALGGGPAARLKREFRALADLAHPGLVPLYELFGDGERFFFTMELVRGRDLLTQLRSAPHRLGDAFGQLAEAVAFLHAAGKLHLDLKPSNVLVEDAGRVVVLDFGLSVEAQRAPRSIGGTPAYMAPEQLAGGPVGEAADWYAVGVMLHEALTGERPEVDRALEGGAQALEGVAPAELGALCRELLRADPAARPPGREVVARLRVGAAPRATAPELPFVGRRAELAMCEAALSRARRGEPAIVLVAGEAGQGKTALLDALARMAGDALVLRGRCFADESMPHKTLDHLIDALAHHLEVLAPAERARLAVPDAALLGRVFPSLTAVFPRQAGEPGDRIDLRRRAFVALRRLLSALTLGRLVVLIIDDVHWGDAEGGARVAELFTGPEVPPVLFALAYRSDQVASSACLRRLLPKLEHAPGAHTLWLGPLDPAEATALASVAVHDPQRAAAMARESGGSPLFLRELCRLSPDTAGLSLDALLGRRIDALALPARRALEVAALAGRPIARRAVALAAELGGEEPAAMLALRHGALVTARDGDACEPYHDRVREAVLARIRPAVRQALHASLGRALVDTGLDAPDLVALHFDAAGDRERAAPYYARAAERALDALDWERAIELAGRALALSPSERAPLLRLRAAALEHSGHGGDAGAAYLEAASLTGPGPEKEELTRLAAQAYFTSGRFDDALAAMRPVLAAAGVRLPQTRLGTLADLAGQWALSRLDGVLPPRPASLALLDACHAITLGAVERDAPLALACHYRALRAARAASDPQRLARALIVEASFRSGARGTRPKSAADRRQEEALERALAALEPAEPMTRALRAFDRVLRGVGLMFGGQVQRACDELVVGEDETTACPVDIPGSLGLARGGLSQCLNLLGRWRELARRLGPFLEDARARSDQHLELNLSLFDFWLELCADRPGEARAAIDRVDPLWPRGASSRALIRPQHLASVALYRDHGVGPAALEVLRPLWRSLEVRVFLRMSTTLRTLVTYELGAAALAAAAAGGRREHLEEAERFARALGPVRTDHARGLQLCLRAGLAAARGDEGSATTALSCAESLFGELGLTAQRSAARRRRGEIVAGDEGRALITAADRALGAEGVVDPARMVASLLPGSWARAM